MKKTLRVTWFLGSAAVIAMGCGNPPPPTHPTPTPVAAQPAEVVPAPPAVPATPTAAATTASAPVAPRPVRAKAPSIYDLGLHIETQDGTSAKLDLHKGHPVIIAMFYARCPAVCPTLIRDIRRIDDALPPATRDATRVLLVSFDPPADTPAVLKQLADNHHVDTSRWTFARADDDDATRELAAALGIRYRSVGDGHFNHSTIITLLDAAGRPLGRIDGLNQDHTALLATLAAVPPSTDEGTTTPP